jgi:hypothetical protein
MPIIGMPRKAPSGFLITDLLDGDLRMGPDGLSVRGPSWWLVNLNQAWRYGDRRENNQVMDGTAGERAYRKFRTGTTFQFDIVFGGLYNFEGEATGLPPVQQVWANWRDFHTEMGLEDLPSGPVTTDSTLTTPDGVDWPAPIQVIDLAPGDVVTDDCDAAMGATLVVRVPRGGWIL